MRRFPQPNGCGLIEGIYKIQLNVFCLIDFRSLTVAASLKESAVSPLMSLSYYFRSLTVAASLKGGDNKIIGEKGQDFRSLTVAASLKAITRLNSFRTSVKFPQPNGCGLIEGDMNIPNRFLTSRNFRSLTVAASLKVRV